MNGFTNDDFRAEGSIGTGSITISGDTISSSGLINLNPTSVTVLEPASYSTLDTFTEQTNSFPAGTENSLMKANIKGLSVYNGILNGDFSDGTTDWTGDGATLSESSQILSITGSGGTDATPEGQQVMDFTAYPDHKVFFYARARVTNSDAQRITLRYSTPSTIVTKPSIVNQESPTQNQWYELYAIATLDSSISSAGEAITLICRHQYSSGAIANGKVKQLDGTVGVFAIDMTEAGIEDKTEAEMYELVKQGYFEGLEESEPKIRTTGKNLFDGKIEGGYLSSTTGAEIGTGSTYTRSAGFTSVKSGEDYILSSVNGSSLRIVEYDANYNFVKFNSTAAITTQATTKYLRFYCILAFFEDLIPYFQLEQGTVATVYDAYKENTFNPNLTLRSLPDGTQDTLQNASDDLSSFIENWRHTQKVSEGEAITSGTTVNITNFTSIEIGSSFLIVLDAGGYQTGTYGDSASGNGTIYYKLASKIVNTLEIDQLYSFEDGYLYQEGTLLNEIDYSLTQNINSRIDSIVKDVEDIDDKISTSIQTLTDGATISWDINDGVNAVVTLEGNRTLSNPSNVISGRLLKLIVKQDSTGSRTLSFGTAYKFPSGTAPTLTATANAVDLLFFHCEDEDNIYQFGTSLDLS